MLQSVFADRQRGGEEVSRRRKDGARGFEEGQVVGALGGSVGVFPVDVDAVEAVLVDPLPGRVGKVGARLVVRGEGGKLGGAGPAPYREDDFEVGRLGAQLS